MHGLLYCTRPHGVLERYAMWPKEEGARTPRYGCHWRPYVGARCCNHHLPAEPLEDTVWSLVCDLTLEPEKILADFIGACQGFVAEQRRARRSSKPARRSSDTSARSTT